MSASSQPRTCQCGKPSAYGPGRGLKCKECRNDYQRTKYKNGDNERQSQRSSEYYTRLRQEVHTAYGNQCTCCQENNPVFLTLDHVNNDGAAHRKSLSCGGAGLLRWARDSNFPQTLTLLCYNCNCGRYRNSGICPHQSEQNGLTR